MVGSPIAAVLGFEDHEREVSWGPARTRELTVNGVWLGLYLEALMPDSETSASGTPVVVGTADEEDIRFLRGLMGGRPGLRLEPGIAVLGHCGGCLSTTDGVMLGGRIEIGDTYVRWSGMALGEEQFYSGWRRPRFDYVIAATEHGPVFQFDRDQYEKAVHEELRRLDEGATA